MELARRLFAVGRVRRFAGGTSGNVGMLFGLLLVPMLGAIGLAVDFGQILTARNKAQVAADAAALQAAGVARELIQKSDGTEASTNVAIAEAKRRAEALFEAYADQSGLKDHTFSVTIARTGQDIDASATFSVKTQNLIAQVFGTTSYEAAGGAKSSSSLPSYIDVYFAMDVSQSMGLGATNEDMLALYKVTTPSCVFGCHVVSDEQIHKGVSVTNQSAAKANSINLRIDVLRRAVQKMIATAEKDSDRSATYRFGLYTMGAHPDYVKEPNVGEPYLGELASISGNYGMLRERAEGIDLGPNDRRGQGDSYFRQPLQALVPVIPAAGDGSSRSKARTFLFIVTDGLRDVANRWDVDCAWGSYDNHCMGVMDPSLCQAFKNKNVTVGVLYTTFLPVYDRPDQPWNTALEGNYRNLVVNNGLAPQISPKLQECASPGWFYEASDAGGIDKAMKDMFEQITNIPALIH